jgi:signal transduction histidine kinase
MPAIDFRALFELSPNSYMLLDRQLRYVAANRAYLDVTGRRLEDLLGRNIFDIFPHDPEDPSNESATQLRQSFERVLSTGHPDVIAFIRYRVPGENAGEGEAEDRFWSATHTPIYSHGGHGGHGDHGDNVEYILQHTVDVTELLRLRLVAQRAPAVPDAGQMEAGVLQRAREVQQTNVSLADERAKLQRLFQQAPGFMAFLRGPGHVFEIANAAYRQLVGHREIIGKTVREALPELRDQQYFDLLERVYRTGEPFVGSGMRALLQREPGAPLSEVFLNFVYQPILDAEGQTAGILVLGYDITQQQLQEGELRRRAEFDQQLLGIVSHDLRNPLNAIGMATALLLKRGQLDEQQVRIVSRIMSSTERAVRLIRDFLDFTQARVMGRIPVGPAPANIWEIARQVFDEVLLAQRGRQGVIEHQGEEHGVWDPDRIAQVVGNLLSNAFQHSPANSVVRLSTRGDEKGVTIDVHNVGAPIPPRDLARLFEPFERGTDANSTGRSIGLGLYISRQIIAAHGGTISVQSTAEHGTHFTVWLPRGVASAVQVPVDRFQSIPDREQT